MSTRRVLITVLTVLVWVAFGMALMPREAAAAPGDVSVVLGTDRGYYPAALAADAAGNIYFASWSTSQVFMLVPATGQITLIAGNGPNWVSDGDGGPATEAGLGIPNALAVDAGGNLYISDAYGRVRKVDAGTGRISTVAGNGTFIFPGDNGDGGLATDARLLLDIPPGGGLALDAVGNLYISDGNPGYNGAWGWLRKVDAATGLISTVATIEVYGSASPLAGDGAGNLYFVAWVPTPGWDPRYGAQVIRKLDTATGATSTVREVSDLAGPVDDFRSVYGMAVDNAGNLYYSTEEDSKVYKVVLSTGVKTELPVAAYDSGYKGY
ncbi:MAG: hypothetical protein HYW07_08160, partial [Candidatus Latescibacteria bacterium]|nr:hypothetical protein [Candidatus Latescibacterota bacterium]